jgi:antitoxin PrlF
MVVNEAEGLTVMMKTLPYRKRQLRFLVASLTVTAKGQVTLKRDLLQHLGIKPGERVDFEKLPGRELCVRAARQTGTIDGFLHSLDGKVKRRKPLSIEDINRIAAAGWGGRSGSGMKISVDTNVLRGPC